MVELYRKFAEPLDNWRPYISARYVKRTENDPDKIEISIGRQRPDGDAETYEYIKMKNPSEIIETIGLLALSVGFIVERRGENRDEYERLIKKIIEDNFVIGVKRANGLKS